jgi:RNA polymerase sigma-70 factor, ECF subfamily
VQDQLVERARGGDREAFGVLAASRIDGMFATARVILRDADRAEDAVQEALVRCWRDLPSLRDTTRFDAWVRKLLIRTITDEFRRGHRHHARIRILHSEPVAIDDGRLEDRDQIERAFQRLSVEHRTILTLVHLQDLGLADAADALGIPHGTAKSRLHYATTAMRASIEADQRPTTREISA